MVTLESALKIAKEWRNDLAYCNEYENAYIFNGKNDDGFIGGSQSPIVIWKESGMRTSMIEFDDKDAGKWIREIDI